MERRQLFSSLSFYSDINQWNWQTAVRHFINGVVQEYSKLPQDARSTLNILKMIDKHWKKVNPRLFDSEKHYYLVLAKSTDLLLQSLTKEVEKRMAAFPSIRNIPYIR
ncbi:hypothetical protein [Sediminibacillus massiliensis]|uniref:hypothetical protein n=1 Tax=Sediminibacillus massiliensis TaxID=1926277 RepID=UPI0009884AD7|nr:hypothetical protein [Sediminibacillus massiliensis]